MIDDTDDSDLIDEDPPAAKNMHTDIVNAMLKRMLRNILENRDITQDVCALETLLRAGGSL